MVASLLRLRLLSLGNRVTRPRSAAEAWAVAVGGVLVAVALVGLVVLDGLLGAATAELRGAAFVVLGSVVLGGFWLLPFALRVDDDLPPRAFAAFELSPGRLAAGLALTRVVSVPSLLLILLLVVQVRAWRHEGVAVLWVAIVAGVLTLALAVVGAQVASSAADKGIVGRNVAGLLAMLAVALLAPVAAYLAVIDWSATGVTLLRRFAAVLEWTPFGVAWAAPGAAAAGDLGLAWGRVAIAFGGAALLGAFWYWIVRRSSRSLPRKEFIRITVGVGLFDAMPPTPAGVVAARSLVYWMRDSRYIVPLLVLPLVPVVIAVSFALAGVPDGVVAWLCVPLVALLVGWSVHNDVAADGTAYWLHVVTGVGGRADRWGRLLPPFLVGAVVVVGGSYLTAWIVGDPAIVLPLAALSACTLLVGLGVGSAASAIAPYPTVVPGNGAFAQPQALRGGESMKQAVSLLIAVLLCGPTIGLVIAGILADPAHLQTAVWVGFGSGVAALVLGTELGALVMNRRAPEILAFTQQN